MYIIRFLAFISFFLASQWSLHAQAVLEDVVYLKNGSVVRGKILEYKPAENIKIEIFGGSVLVYPATEVVEIKKEESKTQPNTNINTNTYTSDYPKRELHNPEKGWYHYSSGKLGVGMSAMSQVAISIGAYHSSGYHFNRKVGLGLGVGIERNGAFNMLPVYVDFRGYMMKTSASMFYSLGVGYNAVLPSNGGWAWGEITKSSGGYYIHPALGVRFSSRNRVHTVIDFGCTIQSAFNTERRWTEWIWDPDTGMSQEVEQTAIMQLPVMLRPTIRVGVIF